MEGAKEDKLKETRKGPPPSWEIFPGRLCHIIMSWEPPDRGLEKMPSRVKEQGMGKDG